MLSFENMDGVRAAIRKETVAILGANSKKVQFSELSFIRVFGQTKELFFINETPYIYNGGVFKPDSNGTKLRELIRYCIPDIHVTNAKIENVYNLLKHAHELQETLETVNQYPSNHVFINFKNGMLDVKTGALWPHHREYKSINQIPHRYNPSARLEIGEENERKLRTWLNHFCPATDDLEMLLEFCGYCMTQDTSFETFLMMVSDGSSGKSTFLNFFRYVIGEANCSAVSLQTLTENKFATSELKGKLFNVYADIEQAKITDTAKIKTLTGNDTLRSEEKFKPGMSFKPYAKHLFSCNEIPRFAYDSSNGPFRRMRILRINGVIGEEQKKIGYENEMLPCIPLFINLCVSAVRRAYANNGVISSEQSKQETKALRQNSDSVQQWLDECCETGEVHKCRVEKMRAYTEYRTFCNQNQIIPHPKSAFYSSLKTKNISEGKVDGTWFFKGIQLKDGEI